MIDAIQNFLILCIGVTLAAVIIKLVALTIHGIVAAVEFITR